MEGLKWRWVVGDFFRGAVVVTYTSVWETVWHCAQVGTMLHTGGIEGKRVNQGQLWSEFFKAEELVERRSCMNLRT